MFSLLVDLLDRLLYVVWHFNEIASNRLKEAVLYLYNTIKTDFNMHKIQEYIAILNAKYSSSVISRKRKIVGTERI